MWSEAHVRAIAAVMRVGVQGDLASFMLTRALTRLLVWRPKIVANGDSPPGHAADEVMESMVRK